MDSKVEHFGRLASGVQHGGIAPAIERVLVISDLDRHVAHVSQAEDERRPLADVVGPLLPLVAQAACRPFTASPQTIDSFSMTGMSPSRSESFPRGAEAAEGPDCPLAKRVVNECCADTESGQDQD